MVKYVFQLSGMLSATARSSIWQRVYTIIFHRLVRRFEREGSVLPVGRTPVNEQFSGRLVETKRRTCSKSISADSKRYSCLLHIGGGDSLHISSSP